MNPRDERLDSLANSVMDGSEVDWDGLATDSAGSAEHGSVLALREVARIARFSRGLQQSPMRLYAGSAAESGAASAESQRWGELLLLEKVGAGATGEVWRAWDPKLQREVGLKFLTPGGGKGETPAGNPALLEEARALARVRHPGVVTVYDIEEHEGRLGLRMEFLKGRSLDEEVERRGALPAPEVQRIALELSQALQAVHEAGLLHCDIKPANIVLEPDGRAVLADFGLGQRRLGEAPGQARISGTPMFMPPERLAGEASTARSDIYSLGVTLRYALTGKLPFSARTLDELVAEVSGGPRTSTAEDCPGAPPSLAAALDRAMAADAPRRYPCASAMAAALGDASPGAPAKEAGAGMKSTSRILAAVVAVAAAFGAALLGPRLFHRPAAHNPVPVAAKAAPAAPAPGPYEVEAGLVRRSGGAYQRLAPGGRVRPGDQLSLEFQASQSAYVYVLNEDEHGESYLLFPQPRFDRTNPIPAGTRVVLPGSVGGRENGWTVTSRGGQEHFLIVSSPGPVPEIEADLGRLPIATPDRPIQYAPVAAWTLQRLRGVGGVSPLPPARPTKRAGTFERFESLAGKETGVKGIWVRRITLENPDR